MSTPIDRLPDDEAGLYALVSEVRRIRALTTGGLFDTDLGALTERLRAVAEELEAASATPAQRQAATWKTGDYVANCPVMGRANVLAPPIEFVRTEEGALRADVTFGLEYQGPPGCVHGGVISLLFDVVLGRTNFHLGALGMTVQLNVKYHSASPICEPLTVLGWQSKVEGRKIFCQGELRHGETLCASAEGIFVIPGELLRNNKKRILAGGD